MRFLSEEKKHELLDLLATDLRFLGKLKKNRETDFEEETIEGFELKTYESLGYEFKPSRLKKMIKVVKHKEQDVAFENKCWCLMYDLGFRRLNKNRKFSLPYGKNKGETKQIDVVAVNDDVVILIECKSSEIQTTEDHRPEIDSLKEKINGFKQSIKELFGGARKIKYILATNNQTIGDTSKEILENADVFHLNNPSQKYLRELIDHYKGSAHYQFMGMLFRGELINSNKYRIPAIKGKMGGKTYYMFSIEPEILLRTGFVLHRVQANKNYFPTYQRLLNDKRMKGISKFINEGGFFPNSVILNFITHNQKLNKKLGWEDAGQRDDSISDHGILKIPNCYAIAYIIDGQHRVYGYSYSEDSEFKSKQTIPVVAFENLGQEEQVKMFMDINENQKAISRDLKETLNEDLLWDAKTPSLRMKALRSGINNLMGSIENYKISKYLSIGEDKREISMGAIIDGIKDSGLLPEIIKEEMIDKPGVLYKIGVQEHSEEMERVKKLICNFLSIAFDYCILNYEEIWNQKKGLIRSVRGAYAYIRTIGELNHHLTVIGELKKEDLNDFRFSKIKPYLDSLLKGLIRTQNNPNELDKAKKAYGSGTTKVWNHLFTSIINNEFDKFTTPDYNIYLETQDGKIQSDAYSLNVKIEKIIQSRTLSYTYADVGGEEGFMDKYYDLFSKLRELAEKKSIEYKKVTGASKEYKWYDMFNVIHYETLWEKCWGRELKEQKINPLFKGLSMKLDSEFYDEKTGENYYRCGKESAFKTGSKWIKTFNLIRSNIAHLGSISKANGVNKEELKKLKLIYNGLMKINYEENYEAFK